MHRALAPRLAGEPGFVGSEGEDRRQPDDERLEDLVDDGERRTPPHARIRVAVKRVLADVEIERRQLGVHELREHGDDLAIVVGRVGGAHLTSSRSAGAASAAPAHARAYP